MSVDDFDTLNRLEFLEEKAQRLERENEDLKEELRKTKASNLNLRKRLDNHVKQSNRRRRYEQDYLPYEDDRYE